MKKILFLSTALVLGALTLSSCSSDDDNNGNNGTPSEEAYKDRTYGNEAIDASGKTVTALSNANEV